MCLFLERGVVEEKEWERNIDAGEKHWLVASHTHPDRGSNLQPRYVSWPGIKPVNFWCMEQLQPTSHAANSLLLLRRSKPLTLSTEFHMVFQPTDLHLWFFLSHSPWFLWHSQLSWASELRLIPSCAWQGLTYSHFSKYHTPGTGFWITLSRISSLFLCFGFFIWFIPFIILLKLFKNLNIMYEPLII